jgi:hypothetical protein
MNAEVRTRALETGVWLGSLSKHSQIEFLNYVIRWFIYQTTMKPVMILTLIREACADKGVYMSGEKLKVRVPAIPGTQQQVVAIPNKFGTTKQLDPTWSAPTPPSQK